MNKRGQSSPTPFFPESRRGVLNKRGQITIFIIIGIILVSAIVLFFLLRGGIIPGTGEKPEKNPNAFLESCLESKIREGIKIISIQGGYVSNPLHIAFKFEAEKEPVDISYLCYSSDISPCVNQEPMLISHLKEEMHDYISEEVNNCFNNLKSSLEKEGYTADATYNGFEVELTEGKITIPIDAEISLTKTEETTKQENFKIIFQSKFYDLALAVQGILNKEATDCEFNPSDMDAYPELSISKYRTSDSSVIYTVEHYESKEKFRFAVRGCVITP
jgi:hypothetical protein